MSSIKKVVEKCMDPELEANRLMQLLIDARVDRANRKKNIKEPREPETFDTLYGDNIDGPEPDEVD